MNLLDIIGPIMIGPSSSHTAGAVRLALLARHILQEPVISAQIFLHGSFADTYKGHGTDLALIAGLLGFTPDDERIPQAMDIAHKQNLDFSFAKIDLGKVAHPNTVKFVLHSQESQCIVSGSSLGGGRVRITEVNDFALDFDGSSPTLLIQHHDKPGVIAKVTNILAAHEINVAQMKVFRQSKGGLAAMVIEVDQKLRPEILEQLNYITHIQNIRTVDQVS